MIKKVQTQTQTPGQTQTKGHNQIRVPHQAQVHHRIQVLNLLSTQLPIPQIPNAIL